MLHILIQNFLFLAIYVLDTFMDNHRIAADRLTIVSLGSVLLAAKIEERDNNIPKLAILSGSIDASFRLCDFLALEAIILKFFQFQLMIPTAATFLEYFIEGIVDDCDFEGSNTNSTRFHSLMAMKRKLTDLALEFVDLMLLNLHMMQELPSKMAAACVAAARCTLEIGEVWPYHLLIITKYSLSEISSHKRQLQLLRLNVMTNMATVQLQGTNSTTPDSGYLSRCADETESSAEE